MMLLAFIVDDQFLPWIFGIIAAAIPAIGTFIWAMWSRFKSFITPLIMTAYQYGIDSLKAHQQLVTTLDSSIPKVLETMEAINHTQANQAEIQARQSEILAGQNKSIAKLEEHHEISSSKLDLIIQHLRDSHG